MKKRLSSEFPHAGSYRQSYVEDACGRCAQIDQFVFLKGDSYLAHLSVWTVGLSFGFLPSTEWITELTVHKTSPLWIWPLGWFLFSENSTVYQFSYFVGERKMKAGLKWEVMEDGFFLNDRNQNINVLKIVVIIITIIVTIVIIIPADNYSYYWERNNM